jgi:FkbM family methyltransferase
MGVIRSSMRRLAWRLGRWIYCSARGEPRSGEIHRNGESAVQKRVIDAVAAADPLCIFDIGANVGEWSIALFDQLKAGPSRQVSLHAFEPVAETRARLEKNLAEYSRSFQVNVHPTAISDRTARARMHVVDGGRRNSMHELGFASGTIEVETVTLSDVFDRFGVERAQLVKVDAEGHDPAIIRGSMELLRSERIDILQFEYNQRWVFSRSFLKDIFDLCHDIPYKIARVGIGSVELFEHWHPELDRFFNANYLLVREPALNWFVHHRGNFDVSNTYA